MANARGATPRVGVTTRARARAQTPVVEEIVPNSGWTEDSAGHYLLVDLPEFRKEEVKLQVDSYGRIVVKGERQANEQKRVHFQLVFPVPVDSDTDKLAGHFDGGILYVTVPKRVAEEKNQESEAEKAGNGDVAEAERAQEHDSHEPVVDHERRDPMPQHENHTEQEEERRRNENPQIQELSEQVIRKWNQESMLRSARVVLIKNKGIVITAVIAFSLGLFISRKFDFSAEP
ncbi:18.0 kDa class II heat shock protein-like [Lotus japonicus]|uniref:18.0 kDa class II heat shock protein-like n=1 Tax=Lotus japonicus TaxID=34305 RepID=UPI00258E42B6|nr:18.0 kDa class II heat shock protein-like [Lotus japonicus]